MTNELIAWMSGFAGMVAAAFAIVRNRNPLVWFLLGVFWPIASLLVMLFMLEPLMTRAEQASAYCSECGRTRGEVRP